MGRVHSSSNSVNPFIVGGKQPLDVRTVVQTSDDLKTRDIMSSAYQGMIVYVTGVVIEVVDDKKVEVKVEEPSLYICHTESKKGLTNLEDGWKKLDVDYSVRVVESESNLTDGTTILFPYQGMMAYVNEESSLYILLTKGVDSAKDINNWRKVSAGESTSAPSLDKVGINTTPDGGSGFKITENKSVIIEDYVNVENHIKANYFYTSKGVNSFDSDSNFKYDSVRLSKGGESYIELFANGDNWMVINDPDNSLGLSELSGNTFAKEASVCFGMDIKFNEGWTISYGEESRDFVDSDYELIDIYRIEYAPEVYAYLKDIDVRVLTEDDLVMIDEKIKDMANTIMIDLNKGESGGDSGESDGSDFEGDSDIEEEPTPVPLQQVIVNMNNSITKLEKTVETVEPETIEHSEIDKLFS